jgi:PAS domain S-box-containing protein
MKDPYGTHQEPLDEILALKQRIKELEQSETERREIEGVLKESEALLKTCLENAPDGVYMSDMEGNFLYGNRRSEEIIGYSRDELIGKNFLQVNIVSEKSLNKAAQLFEASIEGRRTGPDEIELVAKEGRLIPVEINTAVVQRGDQRIVLGFVRDITDRKRAEETLQESEERYRQFVEGVSKGVFVAQDGMLKFVNPMGVEILGHSKHDLTTLPFTHFIHPDDRNMVMERHMRRMTGEKFATRYDFRILTSAGNMRWVELDSVTVQWEHRPAVLVFISDITDRKQAEDEILLEREKLKTLSDNAPFGMVLLNKAGRFTYINTKFTDLFGYDLSDIPDGRTWFRKAYPDTEYRRAAISAWVKDFRDAGPGAQKQKVFSVTCKDGTQAIMRFTPSVLASGDYLMTCEDITELRRLESHLRQAQKMESIGTLTGGVAHDFNNILSALMGYASLMQVKMDKDSPLRPYVDQVLSASRKAADLTRSLLAFSRQQPVTLAPLDMNNTIESTKKLLKRLLTEDIELSTSLTTENTVVMADKSQIDQILFNLVTNARDSMPKGGTLIVKTDIADMDSRFTMAHGFGKPGRYVLINISDTGEGMDEATQGKIFDPFFTTKETGKGTGLGLAIVYGIVKQHGGYITVYSELNRGTAFRIYLPTVSARADREENAIFPVTTGNETILIAEDNEEVRRFMREALNEYGYRIIEAIDGDDAIDQFGRHRDIDLIIVDSVMPKKNGREVYEEIRRINPRVKVLFTSGYTKDIVLNKGIEDKEFDFIAKPLLLDELLQKIREVLDRYPRTPFRSG